MVLPLLVLPFLSKQTFSKKDTPLIKSLDSSLLHRLRLGSIERAPREKLPTTGEEIGGGGSEV